MKISAALNGRTVRGIIMGDSVPEYFIPQLFTISTL